MKKLKIGQFVTLGMGATQRICEVKRVKKNGQATLTMLPEEESEVAYYSADEVEMATGEYARIKIHDYLKNKGRGVATLKLK